MRADARKRLHATAPPDVLLVRLQSVLEGAVLELKAGRLEAAVSTMERALVLLGQVRES